MKLDRAKFIDKGLLIRDSAFNIAAQGVRKGSVCFIGLLKHEPQGVPLWVNWKRLTFVKLNNKERERFSIDNEFTWECAGDLKIWNMCYGGHRHIKISWGKKKLLKSKVGIHVSCTVIKEHWLQGLITGVEVTSLVETLCQANVHVHLASCPCDSCSKLKFGMSLAIVLVVSICA